eukprot:TRINITY_DN10196_c0_g2_i6.p1 TRINITY_DN10196_c0_g2~~TRINITY_DN10196_c0_g2_i6.p1  ORF type:complete len:432 (-),score=111.54 TRINITY_DN10196_c0_g2_i6:64-1359(-)
MAVIVVGGGCFGVTTALELRSRGHEVILIDEFGTSTSPNAQPHELASSTDISKLIRGDYADNPVYSQMHKECASTWRWWNEKWGEQVYHESGLLVVSSDMKEGSFEAKSLATQQQMGVSVLTLSKQEFSQRYPQYTPGRYEGYVNLEGGWAESGKVVFYLLRDAAEAGVKLVDDRVVQILSDPVPAEEKSQYQKRVVGVRLKSGRQLQSNQIIVCAGAWTPVLLPHLASIMWPVAMPVFHFQCPPTLRHMFDETVFPPYCVDIAETGFYGFPAHPIDGRMKVGKHDCGYPLHGVEPTAPLLARLLAKIQDKEEVKFRNFLRVALPWLVDQAVVFTRLCMYCDTFDGDFFISGDQVHEGLVVAAGGSGHAFKFTPILGKIIADVFENKPNPFKHKFAWRQPPASKAAVAIKLDDARSPTQNAVPNDILASNL